ncbi:MAG: hypothetical protein P8184_03880 [Calditrichia bacterium]
MPSHFTSSGPIALSLYIIWTTVTYALEGRIHTLLRPEAVVNRILYILIANFLIGIVTGAVIIRITILSGFLKAWQAGFRKWPRAILASILTGIVGFGIYILQGPPSLNPLVIINAFLQILPVSIAEIVVCWAVVGTTFESLMKRKGQVISLASGILAASILFGLYHIAHSPPFNQAHMILFLTFIGLITSLVYFFVRDIYATIVFHNFFAVFGVLQALDESGKLQNYLHPLYPVMITGIIAFILLMIMDRFFIRKISIPEKSTQK